MTHYLFRTTLVSLGLLTGGMRMTARANADTTIRSYISAANALSDKLAQIVDADTAQRNAPGLLLFIDRLNPLTAQVKALFGVQSNLAALQSLAVELTAAQTRLQKEESRLLTDNCSMEGKVKSAGTGMSSSVIFFNKTHEAVNLFRLDSSGARRAPPEAQRNGSTRVPATIQPDGSMIFATSSTDAWLAADSAGACVGVFQPSEAQTMWFEEGKPPTLHKPLGRLSVSRQVVFITALLAPSVDLYLEKITK